MKIFYAALIRDIVIPQFNEELPGKFKEIQERILMSPYTKNEGDFFREMMRHLDLLTGTTWYNHNRTRFI